MNLAKLHTLRTRLSLGGWTEMVEALDYALQFVPRDTSVENGAEQEVRAKLESMSLSPVTVEWLREDEYFEVKFSFYITRSELKEFFEVVDVDGELAWIKPLWEIVK